MKKLIIGIVILSFSAAEVSGGIITETPSKETVTLKKSNNEWIAFSLRVLQELLRADPKVYLKNKDIRHFAGITRMHGFVIDKDNNDLILFGERDPDLPPLYLEDFVVALQNATGKYDLKQSGYRIYSFPGCTIDPEPAVLSQLNEIGLRLNSLFKHQGPTDVLRREFQAWERTCKKEQDVKVFGVPHNSRFAWVMVNADYDLKKLVDGSDSLSVGDFMSLTSMEVKQIQQDINANGPISVPISSINRFWFCSGPNLYKEGEGMVEIIQCPVILRTEEEYLSSTGKIVGMGVPNPLARRFAEIFSNYYQEIAKLRPIYAQLEGLFRFVALSQVIKLKKDDIEAALDLSYLINNFEVPEVAVSHRLPGRSNIMELVHQKEIRGGIHYIKLHMFSCGGVDISIKVNQNEFIKDTKIEEHRRIILNKRPSISTLYWKINYQP